MNILRFAGAVAVGAAMLLCTGPGGARADVVGLTGPTFDLTAVADQISTGEGGSVHIWGFADGAGRAQYPGPTLIVNEGDAVTVNVTNSLTEPVSVIFPGQGPVTAVATAAPTQPGLMTLEALPGGTVSYSFAASSPGTYLYQSGTRSELQTEMGLVGAIVVRPTMGAGFAYNHASTEFDREYLLLLTDMDSRIHDIVEMSGVAALETTDYLGNYFANYWFINGRNAPDTLFPDGIPWMPTQPLGSLVLMEPGERTLMRIVSAGRDMHPFHPHGNHHRLLARDGVLLESAPGLADLSQEFFTQAVVPGATYDAIFEWTGRNLGWDVYGSTLDGMADHGPCIDVLDNRTGLAAPSTPDNPFAPGDGYADLAGNTFPWEWCADHDLPFPVVLPENQELTFGGFWSGTQYLGAGGALPPGEGGLNPNGGFTFVWHSHTEKELINFDIFPGGMLTILIVEAPGTLP